MKIIKFIKKTIELFKIKYKNSTFFQTYVLILLPIFIMLVFSVASIISYNAQCIDILEKSYLSKLESICRDNETSFQNISTTIEILSKSDEFIAISGDTQNPSSSAINDVSKIFQRIIDDNYLVDSIAFYNRTGNFVCSEKGWSHPTMYFGTDYRYAEYPSTYWANYYYKASDNQLLAPSLVMSNVDNLQKIIIPIVFTDVGSENSDNIIIANLSLSAIIQKADEAKLTSNSAFLMVNRNNRNVFNENNDLHPYLEDDFFNELFTKNSPVFDCEIKNKATLAMSYTPSSSALKYSYVALVPYSDITNTVSRVTYIILSIGIIVLLAILAITYFSANHIYRPIENLTLLFEGSSNGKNASTTNIVQYLSSSIQKTLDLNSSLSDVISKSLPLVQERYLINYLNSNDPYSDSEQVDVPLDFKYDFFCSVIIKMHFTDRFYSSYDNIEYDAIKSGIHSVIGSAFKKKYTTYIIPSETDTLYVLINPPNSDQLDEIVNILDDFKSLLAFDKDYITLKIGIGNIYPTLEGLKKSHKEAVNSVSAFIDLSYVQIHNNIEKKNTYDLSINDENALVNLLILGRADEAIDMMEKIVQRNVQANISDTAEIQLYVQFLNMIFKVMNMKNISYDPENRGDFNIISDIITQPLPDIHDTTVKYIDRIIRHLDGSTSKFSLQSTISYIEEHFKEDISLESIADHFQTTPKYLSKMIKEQLGMNYTDYLAELRIREAKMLLIETDKSIGEIFQEAGFNNRNTFICTFKKVTGLTPSNYRKNKKIQRNN